MSVSEERKKMKRVKRREKRRIGKNRNNNGVKDKEEKKGNLTMYVLQYLQGNTVGASERPASPISDPPGDGVIEIGWSVDQVQDNFLVEYDFSTVRSTSSHTTCNKNDDVHNNFDCHNVCVYDDHNDRRNQYCNYDRNRNYHYDNNSNNSYKRR